MTHPHPPAGGTFASTGPQGHRGRMRTRLLAAPGALADYEILEMLLFLGIPRRDTKPFAKALINQFGSLGRVLTAPRDALAQAGLTPEATKPLRLAAHAAHHLAAAEQRARPVLGTFDRLIAYLDPQARLQHAGHIAMLFLDNRNHLLAEQRWEPGTAADTLPGLVARQALALHATALILVHSRPGQAATPSAADRALSRGLATAVSTLSIALHDTLIIGRGGDWLSLRQAGGV